MSTPPPYVPQQPSNQQSPYSPSQGSPYAQPQPPHGQQSHAHPAHAQPLPYAAAPQPMSAADEKMWATLTNVGALFFGWIVPLITYLMFKDRGPFVRAHTATALNFQLTMLFGYIAGAILTFVLIGFLVLIALPILNLIFCIIAAIKANNGEWYTYPLTIKFVS
ncbi:DUF4870 domain-containing protein (plasmid) [Coraliomargarita sp. W4R53]